MRHRPAVMALFVLLLGACSQLPEYTRPEAPLPARYPPAALAAGDGPGATEIGWRAFFVDPRLRALVSRALDHNRDFRAAVLRVDAARARYRITRSDRLPSVELQGEASAGEGGLRRGGDVGGAGNGGDRDAAGGQGASGADGDSERYYAISVAVPAFELDFWGRVRSLSEAARARFLDSVEARRAFQLSLVADVAETYLVERELAERIAVTERVLGSREETLRLARLLEQAGEGSMLEVQQERALRAQARGQLADLRRQAAQNRNLLDQLVGQPLKATELPPARPLAEQGLDERIAPGLPSELLVYRPDILAAEQRLKAANAEVGAARAAFFPNISLTGALGFASPALDRLFDGDSFNWQAGPALRLPIFQGGRLRGNLALSEAQREIALAEYERTIQTAFREVADALAARRYLAEQLGAQREERDAQAERLRLAELRLRAGEGTSFEVLDARRELFALDQLLVQTYRGRLANAVTLYTALGGGLGW